MNSLPNKIKITGARVHNLKNISLSIDKNKLIVITGLSGSGKSSLAFDTIYAEGQRRYSESFSSYARQFLNLLSKPDVDSIEGLLPTIAITSRTVSHNPRSTLGTSTEIYDYLRLIFSTIGKMHCPSCGRELFPQSLEHIEETIFKDFSNQEIFLLAPIARNQRSDFKSTLKELKKADYLKVRFNGEIYIIEELEAQWIDKNKKNNLEVVVDKIVVNKKNHQELKLALKKTIELGNGLVTINPINTQKDFLFSQHYYCPNCNFQYTKLEPRSFSFNNPEGACPKCSGLGEVAKIDQNLLIPNFKLSILQGAIQPWFKVYIQQNKIIQTLEGLAKAFNFSLNSPIEKLKEEQLNAVLYGTREKGIEFEGIINDLEKKYRETNSDFLREEIGKYMKIYPCPLCEGKRLRKEILSVLVDGKNIMDLSCLSLEKLGDFISNLEKKLKERELKIAQLCLREIKNRLNGLLEIGLGYLTLNRGIESLAGGEIQRMKLATQISSPLSGLIYILDEPTIGLHQKDILKLINILKKLKALGNSLILVEHESQVILEADEIIDMGPGAGREGGEVMAQGTVEQIKKNKKSLTGNYLSGRIKILPPASCHKGNGKKIKIYGASEFNLKNIDVEIPLNKLICLTGVSGSGKSTLMIEILAKALKQKLYHAKDSPGKHKEIKGIEHIDKAIDIDQSPIGRTPRSNPATYTGVFTLIRDFFSQQPEAKIKGLAPGHFSFNAEGKCPACGGEGFMEVKMQFLPSVFVQCETCLGKRYNKETLEIHYQDKNIADILDMSVDEALNFFKENKNIYDKLKVLSEVGLNYLKLGQPATSLSGGEAQRIKLATELSRKSTGNTLYLLDEPTTGLHFEDIRKLLIVLNKLVDKGNTVLIIEHNLEVIKCADWIIDLGPEGGDKGGQLVACGTPKDLTKINKSYTGQYLKNL